MLKFHDFLGSLAKTMRLKVIKTWRRELAVAEIRVTGTDDFVFPSKV